VQDERTWRIEVELDRLILGRHVNEQSLAGVVMLRNATPDDGHSDDTKCSQLNAKKSKKKPRSESLYVAVFPSPSE